MKRGPKGGVKPNHRLMAFMLATGMPNKEVAAQLGLTVQRVSQVMQSPLLRTLVDQHVKEIINVGMRQALDKLTGDAPFNVDFIRQVRDGEFDDVDGEMLRIRLSAAGMLFDRQIPRKTEHETTQHTTITVEHQRKQIAEAACSEVGDPIDAEYTPVDTPSGQKQLGWAPPPPRPIVARPIEDVVAELRQQELAAME